MRNIQLIAAIHAIIYENSIIKHNITDRKTVTDKMQAN